MTAYMRTKATGVTSNRGKGAAHRSFTIAA